MSFDWRTILGIPQNGPKAVTDYLDRRVAEMSYKERRQFSAAFEMNPQSDLAGVAALTFHLHDFTFFYPVVDDDDLGHEVAKFEMNAREDVLPFLNDEKIGIEWREKYGGVYLDCSFIQQCSESELERIQATAERIRSGDIPAEQNWSAKVQIKAPDGSTAWLRLPDYEAVNGGQADEIQVALDDLYVVFLSECTLVDARCIRPQISNLAAQYDDLEKLVQDANNLGYVLNERGQGSRWFDEKFAAALDFEQCDRLDFALDISQNLHCYDYVPDDPEYLDEMGRGLVHSSRSNYNQTIKDAINYVALAESHLLRVKGYYKIEGGFFKLNRNEFIYDCSRPPQGPKNNAEVVFRDPATMKPEEIVAELNGKIERGMQDYINNLSKLHSTRIIALADEISATQLMYKELQDGDYPHEHLAYLLRFENPLEVARDQLMLGHIPDDDEIDRNLRYLMDTQDAEKKYRLDPAFLPPDPVTEDAGMSMG